MNNCTKYWSKARPLHTYTLWSENTQEKSLTPPNTRKIVLYLFTIYTSREKVTNTVFYKIIVGNHMGKSLPMYTIFQSEYIQGKSLTPSNMRHGCIHKFHAKKKLQIIIPQRRIVGVKFVTCTYSLYVNTHRGKTSRLRNTSYYCNL